MTPLAKSIIAIGLILIGYVVGQFMTNHEYKGWVELHVTNSGTFILKDKKIFTVSELLSEEVQSGALVPRR